MGWWYRFYLIKIRDTIANNPLFISIYCCTDFIIETSQLHRGLYFRQLTIIKRRVINIMTTDLWIMQTRDDHNSKRFIANTGLIIIQANDLFPVNYLPVYKLTSSTSRVLDKSSTFAKNRTDFLFCLKDVFRALLLLQLSIGLQQSNKHLCFNYRDHLSLHCICKYLGVMANFNEIKLYLPTDDVTESNYAAQAMRDTRSPRFSSCDWNSATEVCFSCDFFTTNSLELLHHWWWLFTRPCALNKKSRRRRWILPVKLLKLISNLHDFRKQSPSIAWKAITGELEE